MWIFMYLSVSSSSCYYLLLSSVDSHICFASKRTSVAYNVSPMKLCSVWSFVCKLFCTVSTDATTTARRQGQRQSAKEQQHSSRDVRQEWWREKKSNENKIKTRIEPEEISFIKEAFQLMTFTHFLLISFLTAVFAVSAIPVTVGSGPGWEISGRQGLVKHKAGLKTMIGVEDWGCLLSKKLNFHPGLVACW